MPKYPLSGDRFRTFIAEGIVGEKTFRGLTKKTYFGFRGETERIVNWLNNSVEPPLRSRVLNLCSLTEGGHMSFFKEYYVDLQSMTLYDDPDGIIFVDDCEPIDLSVYGACERTFHK